MKPTPIHAMTLLLLLCATGCSSKHQTAASTPPADTQGQPESAYLVYVTNEASGNLSVIDPNQSRSIATITLGKRPRGIHASPDSKTIYVALSGSPIAGPNVDESTLPPADHSQDGIGVFDVAQRKLLRILHVRIGP